MSGNMYSSGNRIHTKWQSEFEDDSVVDTSSQYSETGGRYGSRPPDVGQRLKTLLQEQKYTDVKFVISCGVKPKPVVYAHKAILAIGSNKFAEILYGEAAQAAANVLNTEIQINNVPLEAFKTVVEYLYTDDVYFDNDSAVMDILSAARTFLVQPLVDRCESYFESAEITDDNACSKLQVATSHKMDNLKQRCTQFIQENTRSVIRSMDFKSINASTLRAICKFPKLNLRSEQELFEAVVAWAKSQPSSKTGIREVVEPFLRYIRFLTIPCKEFSQLVQKFPDIFTAEEALNIVMYLSNPSQNNPHVTLPSWLGKGSGRCSNTDHRSGTEDLHDQRMSISLKPTKLGYATNLMCMLELKCIGQPRYSYRLKALKLSFGNPVTNDSCIGQLIITVTLGHNSYCVKEHIKIQNSKEVVVPFTKPLLAAAGQVLYIRAEASEVRNYKFLQFDEDGSFPEDSPFECSVGSMPKENRLFFINQLIYASEMRKPRVRDAFQRPASRGARYKVLLARPRKLL